MKKFVQILSTTSLLLLFSTLSFSQDISGIWRGYFITDDGDQYKYEVQLDQSKKNSLSGVTYSYLDTRFYGKATFTGNYVKTSNAALVQEIKTVELKMTGSSVACIMKCRLVYSTSGKEQFLEGVYSSTYEKNSADYGIRRGGDCGGGRVFLRKVATSDFYVEPFLRKKTTIVPPKDEVTKNTPVKKQEPRKIVKPVIKKPAPKNQTTVQKPVNKPVVVETEKRPPVDKVVVEARPVERKMVIPPTIRERKNELTKIIGVTNNEIEISLYDNGEIDDDTISIYLDGALILANKRLSAKPIKYILKMDEANAEHTLIMVAENLGRIPPNTSLMMIQDGDKRYQVSITSTEQKNAMVRFRYEGKD